MYMDNDWNEPPLLFKMCFLSDPHFLLIVCFNVNRTSAKDRNESQIHHSDDPSVANPMVELTIVRHRYNGRQNQAADH